jgi:HK97 family phage prohead protease
MEIKTKAIYQQIIDLDKAQGLVKAYINTFNIIDDYNEVSMPGSFKKTFAENFKKIYWLKNHDWDEMPGITKELYEDSKGAIAVGQINMKKQESLDLWNDYLLYAENGRSLEHSVRVRTIKSEIKGEITYIYEQKMTEWSTLTRPGANPETDVISLKYSDNDLELLKKALNLNYSDEKLQKIEEQIKALELKAVNDTLNNKPLNDEFVRQAINNIKNFKF